MFIIDRLDSLTQSATAKVQSLFNENASNKKIAFVAFQIFRTLATFYMIQTLPLGFVLNSAVCLGINFAYEAAIEKQYCGIRFAVPSSIGAFALKLAAWTINCTFVPFIFRAPAATIPVGAYLYMTHALVNHTLEKVQQPPCHKKTQAKTECGD